MPAEFLGMMVSIVVLVMGVSLVVFTVKGIREYGRRTRRDSHDS